MSRPKKQKNRDRQQQADRERANRERESEARRSQRGGEIEDEDRLVGQQAEQCRGAALRPYVAHATLAAPVDSNRSLLLPFSLSKKAAGLSSPATGRI